MQLILRVGIQRDDIYDWIIEIFRTAKKYDLPFFGKIDLSPCPLSVVLKIFSYPRPRLLLKAPYNMVVLFKYFNEEALFDHCIRTDLHYDNFIRYPILIRGLCPLFRNNERIFHSLILRCDSLGAVRRLFELVRLKLGMFNFSYCFEEVLEVLLQSPIDRIASLKWALWLWRAEDSVHFNLSCPENWKLALDHQ
jgi:hypothetical protein